MSHRPQTGFSLIEFMIAITVSLVILSALSAMFVANSRARLEMERANQQIENGRYAIMALTDDLQLAGYLSHFNLRDAMAGGLLPVPASKPAPCVTSVASLTSALPLHVQGYDDASVPCLDAGGTDLLADRKPGTDVLVVRRVSTCARGSANCPAQPGAPYFQASLCESQLNIAGGGGLYRLDTNIANLDRTLRNCTGLAPMRQVLVHVYFAANNDVPGDGIPTLKRAELLAEGGATQYKAYSIANGIENLQFEYGIDTDDPDPDGLPDVFTPNPDIAQYDNNGVVVATFAGCAANAKCGANWNDVMSVKVSLLARNPGETRQHVDSKVYSLGRNAAGGPQCAVAASGDETAAETCKAFNDGFKRHVFQSAIRLNNASARRE